MMKLQMMLLSNKKMIKIKRVLIYNKNNKIMLKQKLKIKNKLILQKKFKKNNFH